MAATWNGSALQTRLSQRYGLDDAASLARILEWMNEIQDDICEEFDWPFLKFSMKRQVCVDSSLGSPVVKTFDGTEGATVSDSDEAEISGGSAKLKQLTVLQGNETFFAPLDTDENALRSNGSGTGTKTEATTITFTGDYANALGTDVSYISWPIVGNWNPADPNKWEVSGYAKFPASGAPSGNRTLFWKKRVTGNNNVISLYLTSGGNITLEVINSSGSLTVNESVAFTPTADTEFHWCITCDSTAGSTKLRLDGVTVISNTATFTQTADSDGIIAVLSNGTNSSNHSQRDLVIYDRVQTTNDFAGSLPIIVKEFSTDSPYARIQLGSSALTIATLSANTTTPGSNDLVKFLIEVNSTYYRYNTTTSAWESTTLAYANSNTESEMNSNLSTLSWTGFQDVYLIIYLYSDDGSATVSIEDVTTEIGDRSTEQEIDLSPTVPVKPTVLLASGGALTADQAVQFKITYLLFDEKGREFASLESEPSDATIAVTPTGANLSVSIANIPTYPGDTTVRPFRIHRRIYMSQNSGAYLLVSTIEDNTTTTATITANSTSTIEPPEAPLVKNISNERILNVNSDRSLTEVDIEWIQENDPDLSSEGDPQYFARISDRHILIWPRPTTNITLSYFVQRRPSYIFAETGRAMQLDFSLKKEFEAGVIWKMHEYRNSGSESNKLAVYEELKKNAKNRKISDQGLFETIKVVC